MPFLKDAPFSNLLEDDKKIYLNFQPSQPLYIYRMTRQGSVAVSHKLDALKRNVKGSPDNAITHKWLLLLS